MPEQISPNEYKAVADRIEEMDRQDQEMRERVLRENNGVIENEEDDTLDQRNTEEMKKIVERFGWPTIYRFGEEIARKAFLLVQHADHDIEFQKKCLALMRGLPEGDVSKRSMAYLEDRISVKEGRPQIYGTQFYGDREEEWGPRPIADPEHLDERRVSMGMEPWAEYESVVRQKFFPKETE